MPFNLIFPSQNAPIQQRQLKAGEIIFVLGANGTGKSSLMFLFNQQNLGRARKISAHRQTWMKSDALDMTPSIEKDTSRLSEKSAKKTCRNSIYDQIPSDKELCSGNNIQIKNCWSAIYKARTKDLDAAVATHDWEAILKFCPVRESNALEEISKKLGFRGRREYEKAVRHLLAKDTASLDFVRDLFGDLSKQILE